MEDDAVYREKRPTLSINNFFKMLPFAYWQGFQFIIDGEQIKILSVKKSFGKLKEIECLIPVKLWGIKANSRKANRIGEFLKVTLATYQKEIPYKNLSFRKFYSLSNGFLTNLSQISYCKIYKMNLLRI